MSIPVKILYNKDKESHGSWAKPNQNQTKANKGKINYK
jgi:hypothetical protein